MQARLLGWAGVELRDGDSAVVIDPLRDAGAVWAAAGDLARDVPMPDLVEPGDASLGLLTHLHRDHADADALPAGAPVLLPEPYGGSRREDAAVAEAAAELETAGLELRHVRAWQTVELDGWSCTAVPAADGTGDPQVSWLVARGDRVVFHGGDTLTHGWWWRIAERAPAAIDVAFLPINGARVNFPHRQPASPLRAVMDGGEAAVAAALLRAGRLVPIHYGAYDFPPIYQPDPDALGTLREGTEVDVLVPPLGEWFAVAA